MSGLNFLSRVLGFVRDLLTARILGAGWAADAFFVAFRIPNLLRSVFAEGALTSAFVPVFAEELGKSRQAARDAIRSVTALLLLCTAGLSIAGVIYSTDLTYLFGVGSGTPKSELCSRLIRVMMPYIICVSLVAMLNGALNSVNVFGASAMAQVWMNVVLILGALAAQGLESGQQDAAMVLAISVLAGGIVQVLVQIPALRRLGFTLVPSIHLVTKATIRVGRLMLPAVLGATVYQVQIFLNTFLASLLGSGAVSWLYYADRLIQLPIGVFSISLASVLLPALSTAAAQKDESSYAITLAHALRFTSFIVIPIAALLAWFADPLIFVLFERGAFTHEAAIQTGRAVRAYSLGLWFVSCHTMLVRAVIARQDTKTPTLVGVVILTLTFLLSVAFMGAIPGLQQGWLYEVVGVVQANLAHTGIGLSLGASGIALASSLASMTAMLLLLMVVRRRGQVDWLLFGRATRDAVGAVVVMSLVVILFRRMFSPSYGLQLLVLLPIACLALLGGFAVLQSRELSESFAAISKLKVKLLKRMKR